jgi:hypothetical protein
MSSDLVRMARFRAQSLTIDERPVGILDVFNEDLPNPLRTYQILKNMPTYLPSLLLHLRCCQLSTFESKYPLFSAGTVLALV